MRKYLFFLTFLVCFCVHSQEYQLGFLPTVNWNKKLPKEFAFNLKIQSREELKRGEFSTYQPVNFKHQLIDIETLFSKKISFKSKLLLGYMIRFKDGDLLHRILQQWIVKHSFSSVTFAHRLATDQTMGNSVSFQFRLRYRFTAVIPLNGQIVDAKEFYLKNSTESLLSFSDGKQNFDQRLIPFIGYEFNDRQKLEFGLNYLVRAQSERINNTFWIGINWYQKL
ncbi:MAG: DUF2490 domain-containing protein [Flavobacteriaceae bacterium]